MLDKIKSFIPLNFALMANPVNWVIVFLMIAIATAGVALLYSSSIPNDTQEG